MVQVKDYSFICVQIFYAFVLRAEICTTFGSKVVQISALNTKV